MAQLGDMLSFFGLAAEEAEPPVDDSVLRQRELMERQRALDLEYYDEKRKKVEAFAAAKEATEDEEEEEETKQESDRVSEDSLPPLPKKTLKPRNACCVVM